MSNSPRSKKHAETDLSCRLFWPALVVCGLIKVWLTWGRYLNQDEFETLHQGWLIFQGAVPYRDFRSNHPPLAFEWLGWLNFLSADALTIIRFARMATLLAAAAVLALLYRIGRDVFGPSAARWTVIVYAVNATFWEWSTEVRTDFLMVPLWLAGLSLLFTPRPVSTPWRMAAVGLLLGTAFWVNQKVVFHAAPIAVLLVLGGPRGSWSWSDVRWAIGAALLPATWVLGRAWLDGSLVDLIQHNFLGNCAWGIVQTNYYRAWRTITLQRAVLYDGGFVLLAVVACLWGAGRQRSREQSFIAASAVWMLLTLFLTPSPFAYYLLGVFPLGAVIIGGWLAESLPAWLGADAGRNDGRRVAVAVAIGLYLVFPLGRMTKFLWPTNRYQLQVVRLANELVPPAARVFDGAGTLVTRPDAYPFHWVLWQPELAAYAQGKLPPLLPTLREQGCRLLIDTYRVRALLPEDRRQLQTHFVRLWGPLSVPGYDSIEHLGAEPRQIELWYDGLYASSHPEVRVDGQPMNVPRRLKAGRHEIWLPGQPARVTLRQVDPDREPALPADATDPAEFLGRYGYGY